MVSRYAKLDHDIEERINLLSTRLNLEPKSANATYLQEKYKLMNETNNLTFFCENYSKFCVKALHETINFYERRI